jgi:HAE1 family hydrophobic/amphiphilic exporter-1
LVLLGIVVNNGIVFVDRIRFLRDQGLERQQAIRQAGRDRLRPILMTALTTILGLMPLAVGRATVGGGYYFPLARTVIGGLTAGTFLTLVALPYVYSAVDVLSVWTGRVWRLSRPGARP